MNEEEKKAFTLSFQNNLDNLVRNKINPTAEAIISAEMPMIYLFEDLMNKIDKQQKEIERLKEECIGDTKFDKLLFSIRMLHFHNYVNDKQFAEMIKKLSNENKGE